MANLEEPEDDDAKPRKIRTWWHPLFANILGWQLSSCYRLEEEVSVGKKPLQIDILLVKKNEGELPAHSRAMLAGLVERLGELTLIEFKSPTDDLKAGDMQTFFAYAFLYRSQHDPFLDPSQLHMMVIAPRISDALIHEMKVLNIAIIAEEPGIWRLKGGPAVHPMWILETDALANAQHPLMTVVSRRFLNDHSTVFEFLRNGGYNDLMAYMGCQIVQFKTLGKDFAMQHLGMDQEFRNAFSALLKKLPPEDLLEALTDDQRLQGLSPEKRLKGLPVEDRVKDLNPDELDRLRKMLRVDNN